MWNIFVLLRDLPGIEVFSFISHQTIIHLRFQITVHNEIIRITLLCEICYEMMQNTTADQDTKVKRCNCERRQHLIN